MTTENSLQAGIDGITIVRVFDAPRELVFNAWITPESFATWFGGPTAHVPVESVQINAVEGGTWCAKMHVEEHVIDWHGTFTEVVHPARLAFTLQDRPGPESEPCTVDFRDVGGKTEMTFHQVGGHMDAEQYQQAGEGWMVFFDTMETLLP